MINIKFENMTKSTYLSFMHEKSSPYKKHTTLPNSCWQFGNIVHKLVNIVLNPQLVDKMEI